MQLPILLAAFLAALFTNAVSAQTAGFLGKWKLSLDTGQYTDYAVLEFADSRDSLQVYIDGGPVSLLSQEGNLIAFDFDWTDLRDRLHVSELTGELAGGNLAGSVNERGEYMGTWSAEPWIEPLGGQANTGPVVDISGVWLSLSRGTHKDRFDLTPDARAINEAYDPAFDDPHLRCVSGGMIRMEDGPFAYEIIQRDDHLLVLYEYFHEVRRIWTDGREFPSNIENAFLSMGYSIGHWEGSTLVVETRGMKPTIWDAAGMPISAAAVVTERKYLDEIGRLHTDYTLHDPTNFNRPVYRHAYRERSSEVELGDWSCDSHSFYRGLQLRGQLEDYWSRSDRRY